MGDWIVFVVAGLGALAGAIGVVLSRNPVHAAISLVGTLFAVAALFVSEGAHFLAAVQVIVYAGAIVVLFLFVIMLLGVDRTEDLEVEPLVGQRAAGVAAAAAVVVLVTLAGIRAASVTEGARSMRGSLQGQANLTVVGRSLFTDYVFAFEITSLLLVVAVVGAVVLARKPKGADVEDPAMVERPAVLVVDAADEDEDALVDEPVDEEVS
jgi:NADH-quinone oxidoreductase subunit J